MSDSNQVDDGKTYCESIAKSISEIIRFSLNEEFRKSSCELFGVFSTKDAETEISKRLMSILENSNSAPEKRPKSSKKKSKENVPGEDMLGESSMSTECSSENMENMENVENTVQRNWLQISSQQCRKAVKRKQLKFHSQSHAPLEKEFEFSSIPLSNSQPCEVSSGSQIMDDRVDFCRKKFRESLMENSGKYLRNLNYRGRIRF